MIKINKHLLITLYLLLFRTFIYSQERNKPALESFELNSVLSLYNAYNSNLSISDEHHKFGKKSLAWKWEEPGSFSTSNFRIVSFDESPLLYGTHFQSSPTLIMSLYNEIPQKGSIRISFEKTGKEEVWFDIELSFTGWRHIWVPFYEMEGNRPRQGESIDYDLFKVSSKTKSGNVFFDDIIFSQYQDDRHQYPDRIVPFIKKGLVNDHWIPSIKNFERIENINTSEVKDEKINDLKNIQKHIDNFLTINPKSTSNIDKVRSEYQKLNLVDNGKKILGPPLTFKQEEEYFDKYARVEYVFNDIRDLGKTLKTLAIFYGKSNTIEKKEIEKMFSNCTKYFLDQGWQAGSSGGTRHHIGYNVREIAEAFYMMRATLYGENLIDDVGKSLQWLFNLGIVLDEVKNFHVNIDYLNTQSYYHLMIIFLLPNPEKQSVLLDAYSNYISTILAQQNEYGGFKVDGTTWHHNGHYPAYAIGAFQTVPKIIRILSDTKFRINENGHKNFKNAFLAAKNYSQLYDWGFGNAGRHPLEGNNINSLQEQFILMSFSGNPEGTSKIDFDVASAYLRLWDNKDNLNLDVFKNSNIQKEKLVGYYSYPYAATAVHRNSNWAAIIKGYSKYVWSSEIYVDENRYGRYPANGTIQLLNEYGEKSSGFKQEGWDWNRYPGATIIYLPFKELEIDNSLMMFRSTQTFVGATELDGNGVFGMVLDESNGSNADGPESDFGFPGKLKAKKSIFSFGEKLICIGSNISSVDTNNPTQTTLFQSFLTDKTKPIDTSSGVVYDFPNNIELSKDSKNKKWLFDPSGNLYHILSNNPVKIKKDIQKSYDNRFSINSGKINPKANGVKETIGNYAVAWLEHGKAPKNDNYQYIIYPFFKKEISKLKDDKSFHIDRADSIAHIVTDYKTKTTGFVIFEGNKQFENKYLRTVSDPSILMIHNTDDYHMTISAVQPDLNFFEFEKGKFKNYSTKVKLKITLNGRWQLTNCKDSCVIENLNEHTQIIIECINGLPTKINLKKIMH